MKEQLTAKIYAKSFYELGNDQKIDIANELTELTKTINASNDLENVLFLDVFTSEEKVNVFKAISEGMKLNSLTQNVVLYLISEKRINLLPMIIKEIIVLDDHAKGFIRGTVEGATTQADEAFLTKVKSYLKNRLGREPELTYQQNNEISAGYRVTVEDIQFDASIDQQLDKFKESIIG